MRALQSMLASVAVCLLIPLNGPAAVLSHGGHYYELATNRVTWHVAKTNAQDLGGHLVIVDSEAENQFIYDAITNAGVDQVWLGATDEDVEGTWRWVDGSLLSSGYTKWGSRGEPNNTPFVPEGEDYALMVTTVWVQGDPSEWNDVRYTISKPSLIEYDSPPGGAPDLVLHYTFEQDDGTNVVDESGRGNDGLASGAQRVLDAERGWVCEFDGLDDYINSGDRTDFEFASQDFSFAWWYKSPGPATVEEHGVLAKGYINPYTTNAYLVQFRNPNGLGITFPGAQNGPTRWVPGSYASLDDRWHHTVYTYSDGEELFRIYIDGVLRHEKPGTPGADYGPNDQPLVFGYYYANNGEGWGRWNHDGRLDDVRLYRGLLSSNEVHALFASPGPPVITQQPTNVTVTAPSPAGFEVAAAGSLPLFYQWRRDGSAMPGSTGVVYTLSSTAPGDDGVQFDVVVSNAFGVVTSQVATLTVRLVPTDDLVLHYTFDTDDGATVPDHSGYAHTGVVHGATWTTDGKWGGAYWFDGTNDYIDAGNPTPLQLRSNFTVAAWVCTEGTNDATMSIVTKSREYPYQGERSFEFYTSSGTGGPVVLAYFWDSSSQYIRRRHPELGVPWDGTGWHHVALQHDASRPGAQMRFYVDGVERDPQPGHQTVSSIPVLRNVAYPLRIGCTTPGLYPFYGKIDDVRVYTRVLSSNEVYALTGASGQPVITEQPTNVTVTAPSPAGFGVTAVGSPPLFYQWRRDGSAMPGETGAGYTLSSTALSDDGAQFDVVVSNAAGVVTSLVATLTVQSPPDTDLVLHYTFDADDGSNVLDHSSYAHTGTVYGATWTAGGMLGGAYLFDGTNDYIDAGNPAPLQLTSNFTVAAWLRPRNKGAAMWVITKSRDHPYQSERAIEIACSEATGFYGFLWDPSTRYFRGHVDPVIDPFDEWHHLVVQHDASLGSHQMRVYVDGVLRGMGFNYETVSSIPTVRDVAEPWRIGTARPGQFPFMGAIDDVRIYSRVLASNEVYELWVAGGLLDSDGDGMSDGDERRAGTSPTNAADVLSFSGIGELPGGEIVIGWRSVSGKLYRIVWSTNLMDGFDVMQSNILGIGGENVVTDFFGTTTPCFFYGIELEE